MTEDEWTEKFKPTKNTIDSNASWNGTMFKAFGAELDAVKAADPTCVWTLVDDGENQAIAKGYHHVNRMGYFITEVPATDNDPFDIEIEE